MTILAHYLKELVTTPFAETAFAKYAILRNSLAKRKASSYDVQIMLPRLRQYSTTDTQVEPECDGTFARTDVDCVQKKRSSAQKEDQR